MSKPLIRNPHLSVRPSAVHGLGVFAEHRIQAGEILEECPVVLIPEAECAQPDGSNLSSYLFRWEPGTRQLAIALGSGCLFNHSPSPNAKYEKVFAEKILRFVTTRMIGAGEEIFLNFLQDRPDGSLWFPVAVADAALS